MILSERIVTTTVPGALTLVVGRPGSGVSSLLAEVAAAGAAEPQGLDSVLASWERPPRAGQGVGSRRVLTPEIMGWTVEELGRCKELVAAPEATVVAVDYLQLIGPTDDVAAELKALATERRWRLVLGVMATRALAALDEGLRGRPAVSAVEATFPRLLELAEGLVVLNGGPHRSATVARRAGGRWADILTISPPHLPS